MACLIIYHLTDCFYFQTKLSFEYILLIQFVSDSEVFSFFLIYKKYKLFIIFLIFLHSKRNMTLFT